MIINSDHRRVLFGQEGGPIILPRDPLTADTYGRFCAYVKMGEHLYDNAVRFYTSFADGNKKSVILPLNFERTATSSGPILVLPKGDHGITSDPNTASGGYYLDDNWSGLYFPDNLFTPDKDAVFQVNPSGNVVNDVKITINPFEIQIGQFAKDISFLKTCQGNHINHCTDSKLPHNNKTHWLGLGLSGLGSGEPISLGDWPECTNCSSWNDYVSTRSFFAVQVWNYNNENKPILKNEATCAIYHKLMSVRSSYLGQTNVRPGTLLPYVNFATNAKYRATSGISSVNSIKPLFNKSNDLISYSRAEAQWGNIFDYPDSTYETTFINFLTESQYYFKATFFEPVPDNQRTWRYRLVVPKLEFNLGSLSPGDKITINKIPTGSGFIYKYNQPEIILTHS